MGMERCQSPWNVPPSQHDSVIIITLIYYQYFSGIIRVSDCLIPKRLSLEKLKI